MPTPDPRSEVFWSRISSVGYSWSEGVENVRNGGKTWLVSDLSASSWTKIGPQISYQRQRNLRKRGAAAIVSVSRRTNGGPAQSRQGRWLR